MIGINEITETNNMIDDQHLDIRTITMGISLRDCASENGERCRTRIFDKIAKRAA